MKKIITVFVISILAVCAVNLTSFAEQKTELPVVIRHKDRGKYEGTMRVDSFKVIGIENVKETRMTIRYEFEYQTVPGIDPRFDILAICYNEAGYEVGKAALYTTQNTLEIPRETATIEICSRIPAGDSESYLYREYVKVYAPDGRERTITNLQVPTYTSVGWYAAVTMYAPSSNGAFNGASIRTKQVSPFKVEEYEKVGWYTYEGVVLYHLRRECNNYMAEEKYNAVFEAVEEKLDFFRGTKYEKELYTIRTEAMNKWRNSIYRPMGCISYKITNRNSSSPGLEFQLRNLSYKKIVLYKIEYSYCDAYGNVVKNMYTIEDDSVVGIAESSKIERGFSGGSRTTSLQNIRVTYVLFEDGTIWKEE